jgi:ribosome-associated translation inhibitor RaiA
MNMNFINQTIQFQVEVEEEQCGAGLQEEAERRLANLIESCNDLFGAKVVISASGESPSQQQQIFQIQAIVYSLSGDIVAVKKADTVRVAPRRALDAIEHRVHHQRGNTKEQGKRRELHDWRADGLEGAGIFTGRSFDARYIEEILAEF